MAPLTLSDEGESAAAAPPAPSVMFDQAVQFAADHETGLAAFGGSIAFAEHPEGPQPAPVAFGEHAEGPQAEGLAFGGQAEGLQPEAIAFTEHEKLAEVQPAAENDEDRWVSGWAKAGEEAATQAHEADVQAEGGVGLAEAPGDAAVFGAITGKLPPARPERKSGKRRRRWLASRWAGRRPGPSNSPPAEKKAPPGNEPVGRFIGMTMSGVLAVVVGYYGLNFFGAGLTS